MRREKRQHGQETLAQRNAQKAQNVIAWEQRENCAYSREDKAQPDNNLFFEGKSNSLSSKGN